MQISEYRLANYDETGDDFDANWKVFWTADPNRPNDIISSVSLRLMPSTALDWMRIYLMRESDVWPGIPQQPTNYIARLYLHPGLITTIDILSAGLHVASTDDTQNLALNVLAQSPGGFQSVEIVVSLEWDGTP
jgi:hypothetical protein